MRRSVVLFVMLFTMLWQSVALARVGSTVNALADREHAALHWLGQEHHHHDDGSYHLDDSNESAQHVVMDHFGTTLAITAAPLHDVPALGSAAHGSQREALVPNPPPDRLLRPPRSRP
jgi:hypothetical protein